MTHMDFVMLGTNGDPVTWDWAAYVLSQFPTFESQHNVSGYSFALGNYPNPFPDPRLPPLVSGLLSRFVIQDTPNDADLLAVLTPVIDHINATWPGKMTFFERTTSYNSFLAWYEVAYDADFAGNNTLLGSRIMDERALSGDVQALSHLLEDVVTSTGGLTAFLVSGKGVHNAKPRGGSNAVLPAWRTSYTHSSMSPLPPCYPSPASSFANRYTLKSFPHAFRRSMRQPKKKLSPKCARRRRNCALTHRTPARTSTR